MNATVSQVTSAQTQLPALVVPPASAQTCASSNSSRSTSATAYAPGLCPRRG